MSVLLPNYDDSKLPTIGGEVVVLPDMAHLAFVEEGGRAGSAGSLVLADEFSVVEQIPVDILVESADSLFSLFGVRLDVGDGPATFGY